MDGEVRPRRRRAVKERPRGNQGCAATAGPSGGVGALGAAAKRPARTATTAGGGRRGGNRHEDVEARWQDYLEGEEYLTFSALATSLQTLPSPSQLAEHRWDFELLVHLLHRLGVAIGVEHASKAYRSHYSPDVQLSGYLYSTLLTAFTLLPSYVLNGQEFYVSDTVLDQCRSLQSVFTETCQELRQHFDNLQPYSLAQIRSDVRRSLTYFDRSWCRFEMPALEEIEAIHRQACRPLIEAIEVERTLADCEGAPFASTGGHARGLQASQAAASGGALRVRLDVHRSRLLEKICELNRLANLDGRGRSDMDLTCVLEAERLAARPMCTGPARVADGPAEGGALPSHRQAPSAAPSAGSCCRCGGAGSPSCAPPVLLKVARALLRSFRHLRRVLQRYALCLYQLNSHLANNPDLVRALELFEAAWETASKYLVQPGPRRIALNVFAVVSGVPEPGFQEGLASLDPGVLVASVPRALLFHELRRAAAPVAPTASTASAGGPGQKLAVKVVEKPNAERSLGGTSPALPRPALDRNCCNAVALGSALQRSPLARAFLPPDSAVAFNEAAAAMARFPEARLNQVEQWLLMPPDSGPGVSSPTQGAPCSVAATPPAAAAACSSSSRGCTATAAGRPPRTPCPPRMAVPNSRPPSGTVKRNSSTHVMVQVLPTSLQQAAQRPPDEDSDDEEHAAIDIPSLQGRMEAAGSVSGLVPTLPQKPGGGAPQHSRSEAADASRREDAEVRQVVASISTLAVHLQRAKPQEWNELIQVVLQGLLLARSATEKGAPAAAPPAAEVW